VSLAGTGRIVDRLLCLLAGLLTVTILAHAQSAGEESETEKAKPPLELKLSTTSMMLCLGSALPLNLELTNRGSKEIKIDKFDIWNQFTYGYLEDRSAGRGGGQGSGCDHCLPDLINLKTDKPYESFFNFSLENDFFKDVGKYSIRVYVEHVSSNEVEFELYNCN
jgi:hypothetical protein